MDWAEQTLREEPNYRLPFSIKAIACGHLDRNEDARAVLSRLLDAQPRLTIARYSAFWSRVRSPVLLALLLDGLCKAGFPEE